MAREGISLDDPARFIPRLQKLANEMPRFVVRMMDWTAIRAKELAIENLKGKVLHKRSGNLMGRLWKNVGVKGSGLVEAYLWTDVPYGPVHEFGGRGYYTITPKNKKALKFTVGGKEIFRKSVNHPPAKKRPWLRPAGEQALKDGARKMADELWRWTG